MRFASLARAFTAALTLLLAGTTLTTHAADWPEKPVRVIVPVGAGSANDIAARTVADGLSTLWNQRAVVENFTGAGGVRGARELVSAAPDGYTIGLIPASTLLVTPVIYTSANLNLARDLVPVSPVFESPMAIAAGAQTGINSIADLVRLAKAQPGKLSISTLPQNTAVHLAAEMFKSVAGIDLMVVPYNQPSESVLAAARGDTQLTIGVVAALGELAKSGRLKLLGTTLPKRLPGMGDVPAVGEAVPGYVANSWGALFAPTGTPAAIIEKINRDVRTVLNNPELAKRFASGGMYPVIGTAADLAATIRADRPGWEKIAREKGKAEP